jgi:AraC-like DNA-binding protein
MHNNSLTLINPVTSSPWHGIFEAGRVEANRRLYNHEFIFFSQGEGRVIVEGQIFKCSAGSMVIIPPDVVHCTIADSRIERWCIHFDWEPGSDVPDPPYVYSESLGAFPSEQCNLTPDWVPYSLPLIRMSLNQKDLFELVQELFACSSKSLEDGMRQKGIFLQILSLCFTDSSHAKSYMSPVLLKAKEYIDINFRNPELNISKTAAKNSITPNHLCRIFRQELGVSPLEYINSLRLQHARELLTNSSLNVSQIALETGFQDPNYFSRLFKKRIGVSPSQYYTAL